jgi:hypothetical protein
MTTESYSSAAAAAAAAEEEKTRGNNSSHNPKLKLLEINKERKKKSSERNSKKHSPRRRRRNLSETTCSWRSGFNFRSSKRARGPPRKKVLKKKKKEKKEANAACNDGCRIAIKRDQKKLSKCMQSNGAAIDLRQKKKKTKINNKRLETRASRRRRGCTPRGPTYLPVYRPTEPTDLLTESDHQTVFFWGVGFVLWPKVAILSMRRFSQIWL